MEEPSRPADPFRRWVAYVIVVVSIAGALVSWQAALAAEDADDREQQTAQERYFREGTLDNLQSDIAHDLGVLADYEQHFERVEALQDRLGKGGLDPARTAALDFERAVELRAFQTLNGFFIRQQVGRNARADRVAYDAPSAYASGLPLVSDFRPDLAAEAAADSRAQAVGYVRSAALLAASLFFLTLAQVGGLTSRRWFAAFGVLVALVSVVQFALA